MATSKQLENIRRQHSTLLLFIAAAVSLAILCSLFFIQGCERTKLPAARLPLRLGKTSQVELVAVGDFLLEDDLVEGALQDNGAYVFDHLFRYLSPELRDADLRIISPQATMGDPTWGYASQAWSNTERLYNSPRSIADSIDRANFNMVTRSTRHMFDYGTEGLTSDLDYWYESHPDIVLLGVQEPTLRYDWNNNIYIYQKDGIKIALLNHCDYTVRQTDDPFVNLNSSLSEIKIYNDVQLARSRDVDFIVAFPQWGEPGSTQLSEKQMHYADLYTSLGVDVVIGTGTNTLQRCEVRRSEETGTRTIIYYSLGSIINSPSHSPEQLVSGIAKLTFTKDNAGRHHVTRAGLELSEMYVASDGLPSAAPLSQLDEQTRAQNNIAGINDAFVDGLMVGIYGERYQQGSYRMEFI